MTLSRLLPAALILVLAQAVPALAADTDPIATSEGKAPQLTTAEQIDNYLKTSPALRLPADGASGATSSEEARKTHGEVEIAVGTGGYRSAYARADMPVGKTGVVSLAVQESRFNGRGGPRGYQNLGLGFAFGEAAAPLDGRRACQGATDMMGRTLSHPAERGREYGDDSRRACRVVLPSAAD